MPLISIALCTYNGEKYLMEQLDSLVHQTYKNLEIIVVDDCSSDNTIEILNSYAVKYPFIKIYRNNVNLGYVKNFEKAISLCNGDFIALSDQDDIWDLNKIKLQYNTIGDNLLTYHDSEFVDSCGKALNKKMSDVINMFGGDSFEPFIFFNCVSGHACLIKKELINYCLPFPKNLFHDHWLAYAATNIGSIKYLNQSLVKYRQHENSDTNILKLERKENKKKIYGIAKTKKILTELEVMMAFEYNKDQQFLNTLYNLYKTRLTHHLCPALVTFMFKHYKKLLFISKKSGLSKINFVFKYIWGAKLKRA